MNDAQIAADAINSQYDRSLIPALRTIKFLGLKALALETDVGSAFEFEDGSVIRSDSARSNTTWFAESNNA
jgi:hypothetical protein